MLIRLFCTSGAAFVRVESKVIDVAHRPILVNGGRSTARNVALQFRTYARPRGHSIIRRRSSRVEIGTRRIGM